SRMLPAKRGRDLARALRLLQIRRANAQGQHLATSAMRLQKGIVVEGRRGRDQDVIRPVEEPPQRMPVELQESLLRHDVAVIGQDDGASGPGKEARQHPAGSRAVAMEYVGPAAAPLARE